MSNQAWDTRRLRQRLNRAIEIVQADPEATVKITQKVVVIHPDRYDRLTRMKKEILSWE